LARFSSIQLDAVAGQQRDIAATDKNIEDTYALKTASYTVAGPLGMGAILAGATPSYLKALDRFALPAGIAFQLRDDLIGAFGTARRTGKPTGHDLREGKTTPLFLEALRRSKGAKKRQLTLVFGNAQATEGQLEKALGVIVDTGALEHVEERIAELCRGARASLRSSAFNTRSRTLLSGALSALTTRSR
jgi:geranylgeranyl diphosphate synthase type I